MTQITFSSDVNEVSTDSNVDGSIRWHVYEKDSELSPGDKGIFLRREINFGVLEPEKQIVSIGADPKVYFLVNEWILLFKLNGRIAKIRYSENLDPNVTIIPGKQIGEVSEFMLLNSLLQQPRIVFQETATSSITLDSFARLPAVGEANISTSLVGEANGSPPFFGTRSVSGSSSLTSPLLFNGIKLRIKDNTASSSFELSGTAFVFEAITVNATAFLTGLAVPELIASVKAEVSASISLTSSAEALGVSPTNVTPPEFTDSSVFNVGRTIEVTEGTWDGDPDPTI